MTTPRVFVSYDSSSERGTTVAEQLAKHLQNKRFEVVTSLDGLVEKGSSDGQWVVLVRTTGTVTERSGPNREAFNALDLYIKGRLQGVLAIGWTNELLDIPPKLSAISSYDAGSTLQEQTKAFNDVTKTIHYSTVNNGGPRTGGATGATSSPPNGNPPSAPPRQLRLLVIFGAIIALLLIVAGYAINLTLNTRGTTNVATPTATHANTHTPTATPSASAATPTLSSTQAKDLYSKSTTSGQSVVNLIASDPAGWDNNSTCVFKNGTYIITTNTFQPCMATKSKSDKNFAYQVKMSINSSGDAGGLIFRSDSSITKYYRFSLDSTGNYNLFLCNTCQNLGDATKTIATGNDPLYVANAMTELTVIVKNEFIYLYIDKQLVEQVQGILLSSGQVGLYAGSRAGQNTVATFSDLNVWKLS